MLLHAQFIRIQDLKGHGYSRAVSHVTIRALVIEGFRCSRKYDFPQGLNSLVKNSRKQIPHRLRKPDASFSGRTIERNEGFELNAASC